MPRIVKSAIRASEKAATSSADEKVGNLVSNRNKYNSFISSEDEESSADETKTSEYNTDNESLSSVKVADLNMDVQQISSSDSEVTENSEVDEVFETKNSEFLN